MRKTPQKYGEKVHLGWQAYHKYSPIHTDTVSSIETAKGLCEQHAKRQLAWDESTRTNPNGHHWYHGGYSPETKSDWSVSGIYRDTRIDIPGAEFLSDDPKCNFYVVPTKSGWDIRTQIDLEGHDPYEMWLRSGAPGFYFESMDNAKLWDFYVCSAETKTEATGYGYYFWARELIRKIEPPPKGNRITQTIRRLARRLI
jgi:hypothetical protein